MERVKRQKGDPKEMGDFETVLKSYGVDYDNTMERFLQNKALYLRILGMLFEDENLKKLGDALKAEDYADAFDAAHTLKGVAGNLGLTPLFDAVCEIVEPLRREGEADYPSLYRHVTEEFDQVKRMQEELKEAV